MPSVDGLGDPVFALSPDGTLLYANGMASEVLGWIADDVIGTSVIDLVHPADVGLALASLQTVVTKRVGELITVRVRTGSGAWVYLELRGTHPIDGTDRRTRIVVVARDVTDRHRLDFDQGDTGVLRAVMANMHGMVVLVDGAGLIRSINGAVTRLLGYDPELIRGRSIFDYLHPEDREHVLDTVRAVPPHGSITLDARLLMADYNGPNEEITCEFTVNNLLDDPVVHSYVISAQIATALADARNRVNFLAEHDSRTGLLNRDGFMRNAEDLIQQRWRARHPHRRHRALPFDQRAVRRADRRRRAERHRRPDRQDPVARPDHRPIRRRRVRARGPGIEPERRRDAARAGPTRCVAAVHRRRSRGQLPDPHREFVRRPTGGARLVADQREQRADGRQAVRRGRDHRDLRRRDQRAAPPARPAPPGAGQRRDPAVLPTDRRPDRQDHRRRSAGPLGPSDPRRARRERDPAARPDGGSRRGGRRLRARCRARLRRPADRGGLRRHRGPHQRRPEGDRPAGVRRVVPRALPASGCEPEAAGRRDHRDRPARARCLVAGQHAEVALRRHPRLDRRLRNGLLEPRPPARTSRSTA